MRPVYKCKKGIEEAKPLMSSWRGTGREKEPRRCDLHLRRCWFFFPSKAFYSVISVCIVKRCSSVAGDASVAKLRIPLHVIIRLEILLLLRGSGQPRLGLISTLKTFNIQHFHRVGLVELGELGFLRRDSRTRNHVWFQSRWSPFLRMNIWSYIFELLDKQPSFSLYSFSYIVVKPILSSCTVDIWRWTIFFASSIIAWQFWNSVSLSAAHITFSG
jgi:hypothetical protein